jgi:ABC-type transporter MlaC component
MFLHPLNYLFPIYNWTTTNPLRFVFGLVLFGMLASAPRIAQNAVNKTPERTTRSAYAALGRGKGEEALKQFEQAESMPNVTSGTSAKIHLGKPIPQGSRLRRSRLSTRFRND